MEDKILELLKVVHEDVTNMKNDISSMKSDISGMKNDITSMKSDISILKTDVTSMKGDISVLKTDVTSMKGDISILKTDVTSMKGDISVLKTDAASLQEGQTIIEAKLNKIDNTVTQLDPLNAQRHMEMTHKIDKLSNDLNFANVNIGKNISDIALLKLVK